MPHGAQLAFMVPQPRGEHPNYTDGSQYSARGARGHDGKTGGPGGIGVRHTLGKRGKEVDQMTGG